MSWYFFGGFSAYWIVPSGRWRNHSGCSLDPRVIGRALEGDVERDLDARARAPRATRRAEVVERAELGMDRRVAALAPRRSPTGCPTSSGLGVERVVRALAECACRSGGSAAGRGRRSPSPRRRAAASSTSREGAVAARLAATRSAGTARTRREARPLAVDHDRQLAVVGAWRTGGRRGGPSARRARPRARDERRSAASLPSLQAVGQLGEHPRLRLLPRRARPLAGLADQGGADQQVDAPRPGRPSTRFLQVAPPGPEAVDPAEDRVALAAQLGDGELGPPAVVAERLHLDLGPRRLDSGRQSSRQAIASWPSVKASASTSTRSPTTRLIGKPAAVDLRPDLLDDDPSPPRFVSHAPNPPVRPLCRSPARTRTGRQASRHGLPDSGRWVRPAKAGPRGTAAEDIERRESERISRIRRSRSASSGQSLRRAP